MYLYLSTLSAISTSGAKLHVDFALPARGDLVMLGLDLHAALDHRQHHLRADVVQGVGGGHGEVAFLVAKLVAEVGLFVAAGVPGPFDRIDEVVAGMLVLIVADVVEDEELQFRAEVGDVGDAGRFHVVDRLAGHVARIARVVFLGERVLDVADHRQRDVLAKRIEEGGLRLRQHEHVGFVDGLPAANGGAVEAEPLLEGALGQGLGRDAEVLPQAGKVHEAQIDGLDFLFADQGENFFRRHDRFLLGRSSPCRAGPHIPLVGPACRAGPDIPPAVYRSRPADRTSLDERTAPRILVTTSPWPNKAVSPVPHTMANDAPFGSKQSFLTLSCFPIAVCGPSDREQCAALPRVFARRLGRVCLAYRHWSAGLSEDKRTLPIGKL